MKGIVAIAALIILIVAAGAYYWYSGRPAATSVPASLTALPKPPEQKVTTAPQPRSLSELDLSAAAAVDTVTHTDSSLGIRFAVPSSWKLDRSVTNVTRYASPDFHLTVLPPDGGGLDTGSAVDLGPPQDVDASVRDPQSYFAFVSTRYDDCSNCLATYRTTIAGSPAVIVFAKDDWKMEESATIDFLHDGKAYRFVYDAADMTSQDKAALAAFVRSIQFTAK